MTTRKPNGQKKPDSLQPPALPNDFPDILRGEFERFGDVHTGNIGTIAALALRGGGYFGISVTDDGGSCKLAVRCGKVAFEKRCYSLVQFEALLAYSLKKLTD